MEAFSSFKALSSWTAASIASLGAPEALSSLTAPPWASTAACFSDRALRRESSIRDGDDDEWGSGCDMVNNNIGDLENV